MFENILNKDSGKHLLQELSNTTFILSYLYVLYFNHDDVIVIPPKRVFLPIPLPFYHILNKKYINYHVPKSYKYIINILITPILELKHV